MPKKTKKKTAKKSVTKAATTTPTLNIDGKSMSVDAYKNKLIADLKAAKGNAALGKRIRAKLRSKCNHSGGLRNRTYTEKKTGEKVHVSK